MRVEHHWPLKIHLYGGVTPPMKIAQVAPLMESVPPRLYGGSERIVSYLTEALVAEGHDVTLFASGDSITAANLDACCPQALRLCAGVVDPLPHYMIMLDRVRRRAHEFDIIHFHIDQFQFPLFRDLSRRTVTTLHGRQDLPDLHPLYKHFKDMPLVSISNAQRAPVPDASFVATVQHGLPADLLPRTLHSHGGYLAFLGRISPEKRADRAIRIARAVGLPLKIAAKVDKVDTQYFRKEIEPMLTSGDVEFVGEINERQKARFLGDARALLFPIDWPEPFGLVMIEAMACGTPVLAFKGGSVPEVVEDGVTGYIVEDEDEAIRKMGALLAIDRASIRRRFEARFTAERMAKDYVMVYKKLLANADPLSRVRPLFINGNHAVQ
jgi:glycosyltransferase involved in cell wall biosynthesis